MTTNSIKFMAMATIIALSFVSCQNDNDIEGGDLITLFPEFQNATMIQTRAFASGDGGYNSYAPQNGDQVIAFTYDANPSSKYSNIRSGIFSYTNKWKSTVGCENNHTIDIYSIMPASIAASTMTSNGAVQLDNLKILSDKDVLYSVAAAKTVGELSEGTFTLEDVNLTTPEKVCFAMNHMFSKANLYFVGDEDYVDLRTIEIKKVIVATATGYCSGSSISFGNTTTVTLGNSYTGDSLKVELKDFPAADGASGKVQITSTPQKFGTFYFLPKANVPLSLIVSYNVYDWTGALLTRGGQTVTNNKLITLNSLEAGKEYDIKVTVKPTYLYVLSDTDAGLAWEIQ